MKKLRKRDPASPQYQFCYTSDELLEYRSGKLPPEIRSKVFHHLNVEKCERCRELILSIKKPVGETTPVKRSRSILDKLMKKRDIYVPPQTPLKLTKGQIWTTLPEARNTHGKVIGSAPIATPVLVFWPGNGQKKLNNIIRVIPISIDIEFQLKGESLVIQESSPLGYPILIKIFDEKPMLAGNLGEYRGEVSQEDLAQVKSLREEFLDGKTSKSDKDYLVWKRKEMELTKYLCFPVNEAVWEEEVEIETQKHLRDADLARKIILTTMIVVVVLHRYRKAADTSGIELSEIKPHVLMETDEFSLSIIQKRDQVLLRHVSDTIEPQDLRVDGKAKAMARKGLGTFELVLGEVDVVPESSELQITLQGEHLTFQLQFKRNNGT